MKTIRRLLSRCVHAGHARCVMKLIQCHFHTRVPNINKNAIIRALSLVVSLTFVVYIVESVTHLSHESVVVKVLNNVAISSPSQCEPETDFYVNYSLPSPHMPKDGNVVPNVVHYIWYTAKPTKLKFHHMLSVLSAEKFMKPDVIYFHTNLRPIGEYWERVLKVPSIKIVDRKPTTCLFGKPILNPLFGTSGSNVDRLIVLMKYGGIYLDLDVLLIQSLDPLLKYPCTVGKEKPDKVCGSIIIGHRESAFLKLWLEHYLFDYKMWTWAYNSGVVPTVLATQYPTLVHVEEDKLNTPDGDQIQKIWGAESFDWRSHYSVHLLYYRWKHVNYFVITEPDELYIKQDNSTFSQVARHILYS